MKIFGFNFPSTKKTFRSMDVEQVAQLMQVIQPRNLAGQVMNEGDPSHEHSFKYRSWDPQFGKSFLDPDKDPGTEIAFPMATFRDLHVCTCGRKIITSTRALI